MIPNVVVTETVAAAVRSAINDTPPFDEACRIELLEGEDWDPFDPASWPAASTAFAKLVADSNWLLEFDAISGTYQLVAPDPAGGWDFVSLSGGVTITGFKCVVESTPATKIGANKFAAPVAIVSAGQHLVMPSVSLPLGQVLAPVDVPMVID